MSINLISKEYFDFINNNTKIIEISDGKTEIITPFVDSTGEGISFSVNHDGKFYTITDDGFTLWDLETKGIDLTKKGKRKELFQSQLQYHGFSLNGNKIMRKVSKSELGQTIHDMTQLLININDLTYLHSHNISQQFFEDVKQYFMTHKEFSVFPSFNITGKSRLNHKFNYVFKSKGLSKLTRVYNSIDKQKVDTILTSWLDTTEYRKKEFLDEEELYIILSDEGYKNLNDDYLLALESYDIKVLNFENKKDLVSELGA
ncbi:DUF1828 domain-containing protein [Aerococcaceae bacterium NML190938]|nr:DUF1828 domain-containing protein [Aerococcaceae bacterium NML190938]MCW6680838.1 DUF1828 domain-containing protein [Aerococcaceae bacterium NML130460]